MVGLFYLQINILKLFMFIFWEESNDKCSFLRFSIALKKKVYKEPKSKISIQIITFFVLLYISTSLLFAYMNEAAPILTHFNIAYIYKTSLSF